MDIPENEMIDLRVPNKVLVSCDLSPEQKFLYMMIWNFRDANGIFELSKDLQKAMLRKSYKNLEANLEFLKEMGYVYIEHDEKGREVISISEF